MFTFWINLNSTKGELNMIPVVDFALCGVSVTDKDVKDEHLQRIGKDICEAFKTVGFVYLVNHGVPLEKVRQGYVTVIGS